MNIPLLGGTEFIFKPQKGGKSIFINSYKILFWNQNIYLLLYRQRKNKILLFRNFFHYSSSRFLFQA